MRQILPAFQINSSRLGYYHTSIVPTAPAEVLFQQTTVDLLNDGTFTFWGKLKRYHVSTQEEKNVCIGFGP